MAQHAEDMIVDKQDQLEKIEGLCLPDEVIRAVFDLKGRGTGFLAVSYTHLTLPTKRIV